MVRASHDIQDTHDRGTLKRSTNSTRSGAPGLEGEARAGSTGAGGAAVGSGKRSLNSRTTSSPFSPMASAYERTNARRKIPVGQRDTSSRSSASRRERLILVFSAIEVSEIWRRSRSRRRRGPKADPGSIVDVVANDGANCTPSDQAALPTVSGSPLHLIRTRPCNAFLIPNT